MDGHPDVDLTGATLTLPDGTSRDVLAETERSGRNRFTFRPVGLAIGRHILVVQAVDTAGNISARDVPTAPGKTTAPEDFVFEFTVTERPRFVLSLAPGVNMVSIPGDPVDGDINTVIGPGDAIDLVATYDRTAALGPWLVATRNPVTGLFEGTLTTIDAQHAYFMRAISFLDLRVDIPPPPLVGQLPPTIIVRRGWSLVPVLSLNLLSQGTELDPDLYFVGIYWSVALTFDPIGSSWVSVSPNPLFFPDGFPQTLGDSTQVGRGYWLWSEGRRGTIVAR